jgi:hypothetical protein
MEKSCDSVLLILVELDSGEESVGDVGRFGWCDGPFHLGKFNIDYYSSFLLIFLLNI